MLKKCMGSLLLDVVDGTGVSYADDDVDDVFNASDDDSDVGGSVHTDIYEKMLKTMTMTRLMPSAWLPATVRASAHSWP